MKPPWNARTCEYAAEGGHLKTLKWLRAKGAPWDHWTCAWAAKNGHLKTVQWVIENGAPWRRQICIQCARDNGQSKVVAWLESIEE